MTELASRPEAMFLPEATFSETGLELPWSLTYERWSEVGATLGKIHRASAWWLGDWINFGEMAYGQKYAQAVDVTGLAEDTLVHYASVAGRFEIWRRSQILSFAHHRELAYLGPGEQDEWIGKAEEGEWSRAELRRQMKADGPVAEPERCEACGQRLPT